MKKYARFESSQILDVKGSSTQVKNASLNRLSDFDDYRTEQGYLYMRCRAISSRVNRNWDAWPSVELAGDEDTLNQHLGSDGGFTVEAKPQAKYGFSTFLGKPIFVDHNNHNPQRARGVVVDAKLHVEDRKTASELDPYYATAEDDFHPPTWVELLLEIDAQSFPKLAKAIIDGSKDPNSGLDGVSMGCDIEYSRCSHCSNIASAPDDFCKHVKRKGSSFSYIDSKTGKKRSKKSFEFCHKVGFFELSVVFEPADETALTREVISSIHKEGEETDLPRTDQTKVPEEVNTLRDETLCPVCATQMDGIECPTCSYIKPPENLDNPDLDKVQDNTQALRDEQGTPEETSAKKQLGDAEDDDEDGSLPPANKPMKQVGSLALNGERSIWSVTNKMSAKGTRRSKLANRRVAADPLPAARPDVSTEVEPVGGVMNANNESGSAADSQVSLTDVGGTPTDSVSPDETDAVDSGNEYTKNIEAIPSKTFPNENQHTPVDAQPFPPSDEGVKPGPAPKKTNWHVVAYGPAVEGVDPSDPVGRAEQRVDVTDVDYTVPLQSTETWTGTDGNGVLRQQDPTTSDPWPASEDGVKASGIRMADLQLVDREIDMGITDSAQKYTRLAELSQKPTQIVEATLEELSRVKTAGLSKSAGTSQRGMRMPSLNKTASRDAPADDFLLDSAVFSK